ncbi:MAG: fasciclin domain-containing protein [Candidatus Sumerlaeaceae bacterium]|nr:fasciclin domain-containing protein [Candidatus Sumerlaeaceae bacterium]
MAKLTSFRLRIASSLAAISLATVSVGLMPSVGQAKEQDKHTTHTASMCVVDTAKKAGSFNTLLTAVKAADLEQTLRGDGPFTVFAPTDEAFKKLPEGTVENLLKPENKEKLKAVLTYHVVPGKVYAKDVVKLSSAKTVNGKEVKITAEDGKVKVDDANVVKTDIEARNGVIHVIDKVILPKD